MPLPTTVLPPNPRDKEELLATISEGWARIRACFEGLDTPQLETAGVAGGWRARDLAAHLTGWFRACQARLANFRAGTRGGEDYSDFDAWNARFVGEAAPSSTAEVLQEMASTFDELVRQFREMEPALLFRHSVSDWVRGSTWGHFGEHIYELWHFRALHGWLPDPLTLEAMPATRDRGLAVLWADYDRLYASLLGLDELQLGMPGVTGEWSARDIVAHVAAWQRAVVNELPHILAGRPTSADYDLVDEFNARAVERARSLTLDALMAEYHAANNHFFAHARTLADETFGFESPGREWLLVPHASGHWPEIWAWRKARGLMAPLD